MIITSVKNMNMHFPDPSTHHYPAWLADYRLGGLITTRQVLSHYLYYCVPIITRDYKLG